MSTEKTYSQEECQTFAKNFNEWAEREGLAYTKLSIAVGRETNYVSRIVRGIIRLDYEFLENLSGILKFDAEKFLKCVPEEKPGREFVRINFIKNAEKEKQVNAVKCTCDTPDNIPDEPGRFRYKKALYEKDKKGKIWFIDNYGMHWPCNPAICKDCKWRAGSEIRTDKGCRWYEINGNWKLEFKHGYSCDMYEKGRRVKT